MFVSCECLCCPGEVSATGRSLVQRSPADCGVSECYQVKTNKQPRHLLSVGRRGKDYDNNDYRKSKVGLGVKQRTRGPIFCFNSITNLKICLEQSNEEIMSS
jgi:hypothetical protein